MEPPRVEYKDLAGTATFIGSAVLMVWGIIGPILPAILLTASVSYLFQRWNQRDVRKYEKRRMLVIEALGPVHGELLRIVREFESKEKYYQTYVSPTPIWSEIRSSYRYYLIPLELREQLEGFFLAFEGLATAGDLNTQIRKIAIQAGNTVLKDGPPLIDKPVIQVGTSEATAELDLYGSIFWKVEPAIKMSAYFPGETVQVRHVKLTIGDRPQQIRDFADDEAREYTKNFLQRAWEESDKDTRIEQLRRNWKDVHATANRLYDEVKREIEEWAE